MLEVTSYTWLYYVNYTACTTLYIFALVLGIIVIIIQERGIPLTILHRKAAGWSWPSPGWNQMPGTCCSSLKSLSVRRSRDGSYERFLS